MPLFLVVGVAPMFSSCFIMDFFAMLSSNIVFLCVFERVVSALFVYGIISHNGQKIHSFIYLFSFSPHFVSYWKQIDEEYKDIRKTARTLIKKTPLWRRSSFLVVYVGCIRNCIHKGFYILYVVLRVLYTHPFIVLYYLCPNG